MKERDIFEAALAITDRAQRESFLAEVCEGDCELKRRVAGAVEAHRQLGSFLERPAGDFDATADVPGLEQPGQMIGPYKLRERLGAGGMGVVWAAEQKYPLRRKVALKLIKPGMDSEQVLARFETEREALSLMDHPNIAQVLDAGTTPQGRPYFAMELIRGVPITEYCDAHEMSLPERLQLFVHVCRAVQHAHQKGIIHRDIKPLNVLVTEKDGQPIPKIIDFGVAKALCQTLTDLSIYSGLFQAIGTVAYMSPEQAGLSCSDVDSRADVYGLGVLLYELITGKTPFDKEELASAALEEACRIIREKDPPTPSATIGTLGERAVAISKGRGTSPVALGRFVRGELDWIVMKSLEKDRNRRYESASSLSDDIRRFLAGEAVSVSPPSRVYQFRRFCRRNKGTMAAVGFVAILVFVIAVVSSSLVVLLTEAAKKRDLLLVEIDTQRDELQQANQRLEASNIDLIQSQSSLAELSYARAMAAAYMEWTNWNPDSVVRLLAELRSYRDSYGIEPGIEWNLLWNQVQREFADFAGMTIAQTSPFVAPDFSADGRQVAVPVPDAGVLVLDLQTNQQRMLAVPPSPSTGLFQPIAAAFAPTDGILAVGVKTGDDQGQVIFIDQDDRNSQVIDVDFEPWRLKFSPDGHNLNAGSAWPAERRTEGLQPIWNRQEGESEPASPVPPPIEIVRRRGNRAVDVIDAETKRLIRRTQESVDVERAVTSPTGNHLLTISLRGRVKLWDLRQNRTARTESHTFWFIPLAAQPNGQVVAMPFEDRGIRLWNPSTQRSQIIQDAHSDYVAGLAFSPDGGTLVSGGFDGRLRLWDASSGRRIRELADSQRPIWTVVFSRDGRMLASGGEGGEIRLWDTETGRLLHSCDDPDQYIVRGLDFLPCGEQLVSASGHVGGGAIRWWNLATGEMADMYKAVVRVDCVRVSADGRWIAAADRFGEVMVFCGNTRRRMWESKVAGSYVAAVSFSSDSSRLICAAPEGILFYQNRDPGWVELGRLSPVNESFRQAVVLPDDDGLVTASLGGNVYYWPMHAPGAP